MYGIFRILLNTTLCTKKFHILVSGRNTVNVLFIHLAKPLNHSKKFPARFLFYTHFLKFLKHIKTLDLGFGHKDSTVSQSSFKAFPFKHS